MQRALAFRFRAPDLWNQEPCWYRAIVVDRPDLVAEAFVSAIRSTLRRGAGDGLGLYELGHDDGHRPVARLALGPLLTSFPVRSRIAQLNILKRLIFAALRHLDRRLASPNSSRESSRSAAWTWQQRIYWLCGGLLADPTSFADRLRQALTRPGHQQRVRHMAQFFIDIDDTFVARLDSSASELLIASLGSSYRPPSWTGDDSVTAANAHPRAGTYTPLFVDTLIANLASDPSNAATDALEGLCENPRLKPWHRSLQDATSRQREVCRAANFGQPTVEQVLETLDNRRPANAADLAAITVDILVDLARDIRHGNTSDWRQYWNVDSYNRAEDPKPEDACRDALLSDLKAKIGPTGRGCPTRRNLRRRQESGYPRLMRRSSTCRSRLRKAHTTIFGGPSATN